MRSPTSRWLDLTSPLGSVRAGDAVASELNLLTTPPPPPPTALIVSDWKPSLRYHKWSAAKGAFSAVNSGEALSYLTVALLGKQLFAV